MGLFKRAGAAMGHVDHKLIERGLLARGLVTECKRTAMTTGRQVQSVICDITVEIELEDRPVYTAHTKHPIQMPYLPQFESGQGSVAVRVDPDDPQNIALDLTHDVPPPRAAAAAAAGASTVQVIDAGAGLPADVAAQLAAAGIDLGGAAAGAAGGAAAAAVPQNRESPVSAADILATGTPCRVIVQSAQPLGFQKDGRDVWGLVLNVVADGEPPAQARIGVGIPPEGVARLFPGANLPARRRADVPDGVTIDWDAAP